LKIKSEGRVQKFLPKVEQITYNAELGLESNQPVIYVTERAVFELTEQGVKLIEVAPGIDIEQDILNQMGFEPIIDDVKDMNSAIFQDEKMGLLDRVLDLKLIQRVDWDSKREILFLNFEDMSIRNTGDIDEIRRSIEEKLKKLDRKVDVVVNYDRFDLHPDVAQEYAQMVEYLQKHYYQKVSRYAKNGFQRLKLYGTLSREISPRIFETQNDAISFLNR
jgi:propionate CoA-transferase